MASKRTMLNQIEKMTTALKDKPFQVTGFSFILDDYEAFNPFDESVIKDAGFYIEQAPNGVKGFVYVSNEYLLYLKGQKEGQGYI